MKKTIVSMKNWWARLTKKKRIAVVLCVLAGICVCYDCIVEQEPSTQYVEQTQTVTEDEEQAVDEPVVEEPVVDEETENQNWEERTELKEEFLKMISDRYTGGTVSSNVHWCGEILEIDTWSDGGYANALAVASGNKECEKAWTNLLANMMHSAQSIQTQAEDFGLDGIDVECRFLSEKDQSTELLTYCTNGSCRDITANR